MASRYFLVCAWPNRFNLLAIPVRKRLIELVQRQSDSDLAFLDDQMSSGNDLEGLD